MRGFSIPGREADNHYDRGSDDRAEIKSIIAPTPGDRSKNRRFKPIRRGSWPIIACRRTTQSAAADRAVSLLLHLLPVLLHPCAVSGRNPAAVTADGKQKRNLLSSKTSETLQTSDSVRVVRAKLVISPTTGPSRWVTGSTRCDAQKCEKTGKVAAIERVAGKLAGELWAVASMLMRVLIFSVISLRRKRSFALMLIVIGTPAAETTRMYTDMQRTVEQTKIARYPSVTSTTSINEF
jgi:hypothetical protein